MSDTSVWVCGWFVVGSEREVRIGPDLAQDALPVPAQVAAAAERDAEV